MKRSRAVLLIALIVSSIVALVLFLPARWVVPLVQPRLHGLVLGEVHGLLWQGAAEDVRGMDGRRLGRVQWTLARSALWGELDLELRFNGEAIEARGRLRRDAQRRPVWSDVALNANLAATPHLANPLGTPLGALSVTVQRAVLQADWPMELAGQVHWQDAALQTRSGLVALGTLDMDIAGTHGVLGGRLQDDGRGPLQVRGDWQASPLGWRLDLQLDPRTADPALRRWLARLGRPAADGSVQLHRRGGLAAAGGTVR